MKKMYRRLLWMPFFFLPAGVLAQESNPSAEDLSSPEDEILEFEEPEVRFSMPNDGQPDLLTLSPVEVMARHARMIYYQTSPFIQPVDTSATQSINDWLERAPGVFGDANGKGQRLVYIRGFSTRQITARFENMPLDTGYDGITGLDTLPMNWIGSGEIKHADAHADDAIGLGASVLMKAFDPKLAEAAFEMSLTGANFSVSHGMRIDGWHWAVTAGGKYSEGFRLSHAFKPTPQEDGGMRDATKSYGYNALARVGKKISDWGNLEMTGGYTQAPHDVPTGIATGYYRYWRFSEYHIGFVNANLRYQTAYLNGYWQLWYNHQGNRLEAFDTPERNTQTTAAANNSEWKDRDIGTILYIASSPLDIHLGFLEFFLRNELRYQTHNSSECQIVADKTVDKSSQRLTFDIRPGVNWQVIPSLFISAAGYAVGNVELEHSDSGRKDGLANLVSLYNGGFTAGFDYIPNDGVKISFRAARRLRMPTLKEQFSRTDSEHFTLNAEVAWNFQLQIDYAPFEKLKFQVTGYDSEVKDLINYRYISDIKEAYNIDDARIAGIDISAHFGPFFDLTLDIAYGYLFTRDTGSAQSLTERPEHNFRASLAYAPIDWIAVTLKAQYESERRTEAWMSAKSAWMGSIFTLDAQVDFKLPYFSAYIKGANLLDYDYARAFGYPEPGFQLFVGAKIALD